MKKRKPVKRKTSSKKTKKKNYVVVTTKSYGNNLKGIKIFFEGKRPKKLRDDGSIVLGKNILELLKLTFTRFNWILTDNKDEINVHYGITKVYTSIDTINKIYKQLTGPTKDLKEDFIKRNFSLIYPGQFKSIHSEKYRPGTIAVMLKENILNDISLEDKEALNKFIPEYTAAESAGLVSILNANAQVKTLKELAAELEAELLGKRSEHWWQEFIRKNIMLIQQGYIKAIEKMNVSIGSTKLPDFSLVSHDNFLDVLEIKTPSTDLIYQDTRHNYRWGNEISSAIIQTENYLEAILNSAAQIQVFIKEKHEIDLKVLRPRGMILAGNASKFTLPKEKSDFRLLTQSLKNISVITYDELVIRLKNFIKVLEDRSVTK